MSVLDSNPSAPDGSRSPGSRSERTPLAVFVGSWLPYSETFIYDQLCQMRRLTPWVIAAGKTRFAPQFPWKALTSLGPLDQMRLRYLGRCARVEQALDASDARLALAHFGPNGALALPFAQRRGIPLVVLFHGHGVGGLLPINRLRPRYYRYQKLAPALFDYASLLVCASEELKATLLSLGAPADKLSVHRLGIDTSRFAPAATSTPSEHSVVLMIGRLVEKKGMTYGLQAFARIHSKHPNSRMRIVGEGPLRARLMRQAKALGIAEQVQFVGSLKPAGVIEEMRGARVLLTPSVVTSRGDRESGVLVVKEAGAIGLPTVATRHGGIPEILDDPHTGFLFDERDVSGLAQGVGRLLADADLARRMGRNARDKMVREYEHRTQVQQFESLLLSTLPGTQPPRHGIAAKPA